METSWNFDLILAQQQENNIQRPLKILHGFLAGMHYAGQVIFRFFHRASFLTNAHAKPLYRPENSPTTPRHMPCTTHWSPVFKKPSRHPRTTSRISKSIP